MNIKCLLLGFCHLVTAFWTATGAENVGSRGNRDVRRYQPKTTFCSHCHPQHRHLLLLSAPAVGPKFRKCFSMSSVSGLSVLPSVLPQASPETFVLIIPAETSITQPEVLTVMAENLGNVSVVAPSNSSNGRFWKACRSLGAACHLLDNLFPVLEQLGAATEAPKSLFGLYEWPEDTEFDENSFPLHRQFERLIGQLCKRDTSRNRLIEILKEPSTSSGKDDVVEDFRFGLSLKDILPVESKSYDKNRPPKMGGRPTVVYFHVTVLSLDSINEESMTYVADIFLAQSWRDPRLRLPESMSQEYRILDVDWLHDIWRPDCFFKNAKQVTFHEITIPNHYVWLYNDKTLLYISKLTLVLSCAMKFESYPHDIQVCSIMIESLSHTVQDLVFLWNTTDPLVVNPEIELPQLDISNNYTSDCTVRYSTGNFTCLAVVFTLKRRLGYHLLHTYIPSALIVVMSWISFWIKPEAIPARVTLGVTSLLTLATQNTQSQQSLPPVSYVKAIDIWMSSCSVFVFLSLMEFAIVNNYMGPISGRGMPGYSEEDLRAAVEDYRLHPALRKATDNPTCYGKEAALCIDRFSSEMMKRSGVNVSPKLNEAKRKFRDLLGDARKKGCSPSDFAGLPSALRLLQRVAPRSEKPSRGPFWALFAGVLAALVYTNDVHTLQGFSSLWLKWTQGSTNQLCTIPMPDELLKIFRPPVSCSICRGVTEVEKVSKLTPEVFEERYAYSGRPVVVTDGMSNWTAQHVFGFDFFRKIYTRRMDQWRLYKCQFFPYSTEFRHLEEVFNMSEERAIMAEGTAPWYVGWSNCDDEINQILRRHYERPYFLPETAETKKLDWIFMGSSGFGAPMHVDHVEHPSWQAQLRGKKKWRLQPPPECFYICQGVEVIVEPGEIIVLDTNRWYHSTLIVSKEMSITIGAEYD